MKVRDQPRRINPFVPVMVASEVVVKFECLVEANTNNSYVLQSMFLQSGGSYRGESDDSELQETPLEPVVLIFVTCRSKYGTTLITTPNLCCDRIRGDSSLCYKWPYNESKNPGPSTPSMCPFRLPTTLDYFRKTPSGVSCQRSCCHSQIQPPLPHSKSLPASLSGLWQVRRSGRRQMSR